MEYIAMGKTVCRVIDPQLQIAHYLLEVESEKEAHFATLMLNQDPSQSTMNRIKNTGAKPPVMKVHMHEKSLTVQINETHFIEMELDSENEGLDYQGSRTFEYDGLHYALTYTKKLTDLSLVRIRVMCNNEIVIEDWGTVFSQYIKVPKSITLTMSYGMSKTFEFNFSEQERQLFQNEYLKQAVKTEISWYPYNGTNGRIYRPFEKDND